jgi:aquaporin TIP
MSVIYCTASISGGQLNPAVTFAVWLSGTIPFKKMLLFWTSQITGGVCGAILYYALDPDSLYPGAFVGGAQPGCTLPCGGALYAPSMEKHHHVDTVSCGLSWIDIFAFEFLATFMLVFTVFATAIDTKTGAKQFAPISIGFSLFAAATAIGGFTGGSLNPARTLCPALVFSCWSDGIYGGTHQWTYVIAQLLAGAAACFVYQNTFMNRPDDGGNKPSEDAFRFAAPGSAEARRRLRRHHELVTGEEDKDILAVDPHHYDRLRKAAQQEVDPSRDRLFDAREAPESSGRYGSMEDDEGSSLLQRAEGSSSPVARISPSYTARLNSIIEKQAANLKMSPSK